MKKPFVILFAGPVGSSKSTIAHYLSWNLDLPIFSNDSVRREVALENGEAEGKAYLERRNAYLKRIIDSKKDFICDASIDRSWEELGERLKEQGYDFFIISLDVSESFLKPFLERYDYSMNNAEKNYKEHQIFLDTYSKIINLHITDKEFSERLDLSLQAVKNTLNL